MLISGLTIDTNFVKTLNSFLKKFFSKKRVVTVGVYRITEKFESMFEAEECLTNVSIK